MKIKNIKIKFTKLLTVLLALCMVLSLVPMTAFATTIELPAGVSREYLYNHTYHTKVKITANVSVKDAGGSVIETAQVNKSGDFVEGNVSDPAVQAEIQGFDAEINAPYSSRGTLAVENRTTSLKFDHFDGSNLYSFVPASGDTVDFGTDTEAIEQYFAEHPDAVGTFNTINNVREYQVHQMTYDLIVQEFGNDQTITDVSVVNVNTNLSASTPVAFTAQPDASCADKFDITEEMWEAARPLDDIIKNTDTPRAPIAGGKYWYSLVLTAKPGYEFSRDFSENSGIKEGSGVTFTVNGVSYTGRIAVSADGKTLTAWEFMDPVTVSKNTDASAITQVNIESLYKYGVGDSPGKTAEPFDEEADKYEIVYECWEEMENGDPVAFWYSDENRYTPSMKRITQFEDGKSYMYSIELREKAGYTFADNCIVRINVRPQSTVIKTQNGLFIPAIDTIHPAMPKEIETVEINNATLSFRDGDKPVFTGTIPDNEKYVLVFEEWKTDGEWTRSDEWFNDADHHGDDKDITAFDKNKTYRYNLYIKLTAKAGEGGWVFGPNTVLKINGKKVSYTYRSIEENENGYRYSFGVATDLTMTPSGSASHTHNYGTEWKYDGANHWHECACGDKADTAVHTFKWVTDKEATSAEKGSKHEECTVCGYKKAAVEIPATGSGNGSANQPGKPGNTSSPQTGDNNSLALWFAVLFISGGVLAVLCVANKKKKVKIL